MFERYKFPRFVTEQQFKQGEEFTPLDYLRSTESLPYAMAAQWLYIPDFTEYRGLFLQTEDPEGITEERRLNHDANLERYGNDAHKVEWYANWTIVWSVLGINDPDDVEFFDDDAVQLGRVLQSAWRDLLKARFPTVAFETEFMNDDDHGPSVTFYRTAIETPEHASDLAVKITPIKRTRFPDYLTPWREINKRSFTPTSYLGTGQGTDFTIASQWLYIPDFAAYRGGVFRTELPQGLTDKRRQTIDDLFREHNNNVAKVEEVANRLRFEDVFNMDDPSWSEQDLVQMAQSVGYGWEVFAHAAFPGRRFRVERQESDQDHSITLYSQGG